MLEMVLAYLKNWFTQNILEDEYVITNGNLTFDKAQENQYVRIVGSVFNDGVYQCNSNGLTGLVDETFIGEIWLLAIPSSLLQLVSKIEDWNDKNAHKEFQSESFGGYSYSRPSDSGDWEKEFGKELKRWRKL